MVDQHMNVRPTKPLQYSVRALLVTITAVAVLLFLLRPLDWNKALQDAARPADRIVVERINGGTEPLPGGSHPRK